MKLYYQPPYNWSHFQQFLNTRLIPGLEWSEQHSYGRTFTWANTQGTFTATHLPEEHCFQIDLNIDDTQHQEAVIYNIKRILDLDADIPLIEQTLQRYFTPSELPVSGLRLPGTWSLFEAGIRAILGQQVSVVAAHKLVANLVQARGQPYGEHYLFPTPQAIAERELDELRLPASRKQTLQNLARHYLEHDQPDDPVQWLALKGIGPWTIDYARMRGLSEPDIYLAGDLGVKKATSGQNAQRQPELAAPWRSYLTLQLWSSH